MYQEVSKYVWDDKPTLVVFHRQGNAPLNWTTSSFDEVAAGYIQFSDWVGVDPYIYPYNNGTTEHPLGMIGDDADWATQWSKPIVVVGQSYDPPLNLGIYTEDYGWAPFFEEENGGPDTTYVMPNDTIMWKYYDVATSRGAKALLWWWYPDPYASSFETENQQMGVLPVHNVWSDQLDIWLAADLGCN